MQVSSTIQHHNILSLTHRRQNVPLLTNESCAYWGRGYCKCQVHPLLLFPLRKAFLETLVCIFYFSSLQPFHTAWSFPPPPSLLLLLHQSHFSLLRSKCILPQKAFWVLCPALPVTHCVTLHKSLLLPVPQFKYQLPSSQES